MKRQMENKVKLESFFSDSLDWENGLGIFAEGV